MDKLYIVMVYDFPEGICTEDKQEEIIEFWAKGEFDGDVEEAKSQIYFLEHVLNKIGNKNP